jgi:hypothetical protein
MSRLSRVIAPMLHAAGLDVRPVGRADGDLHELIVTNPRYPNWGRVVIDRDGRMQWDYWGHVHDDRGAADIAAMVIAVMANRPGTDPARHARTGHPAAPGDLARPHPRAPAAQPPPTTP